MADINKVIVIDVENKASQDLTQVSNDIEQIGSKTQGSINELRQLKKELRNAAAGSDEFKRLFNEIDDLEEKIKGTKKASSDWVDSIAGMPGPLGSLGKAINGVKEGTVSFGAALKATGIGLIVSLLGGLVAAFSQNEVAMKKIQPLLNGLQKILGGIFRAMEPLLDIFLELAMDALPYVTKGIGIFYSALVGLFTYIKEAGGGAIKILKGIATLDFSMAKEGLNQIKDSFTKAADAGVEAYKRFEAGSKELTKAEKEELEKRQKAADEAAAKKKAAGDKAVAEEVKRKEQEAARLKAIEDKKLADELALAKEVMDKERSLREAQETPLQKEEREYQEWLVKYKANNLNTELLTKQHLENVAKIIKEGSDKKIDKEDSEWLKLQQLTLEKDEYDKLVLTQKYEAEYLAAEGNAELQKELKKKFDKDIADIDDDNTEKELAKEKEKQAAKFQLAQDGLSLVSGLAELFAGKSEKQQRKAFEIQKAVSLASAVISGIEGTQNAYTTAQSSPLTEVFPAYPLVQAGLAAAFSAVKVAQISKQQFNGGAAAGGGAGGGVGGAAPAPQAQFNIVGQSSTNQLAGAIAGAQQQPIQAFVVGSDVTTQQALDRQKINNSTFL